MGVLSIFFLSIPLNKKLVFAKSKPSICILSKIINWKGANCRIAYPDILSTSLIFSMDIHIIGFTFSP